MVTPFMNKKMEGGLITKTLKNQTLFMIQKWNLCLIMTFVRRKQSSSIIKIAQTEIGDLLNWLLSMGHVDTIVINADNGVRYTIDLADNNRNCDSQDFLVTEEPIQGLRY